MNTWIAVEDELPIIPDNRYGVSVLIVVHDYTEQPSYQNRIALASFGYDDERLKGFAPDIDPTIEYKKSIFDTQTVGGNSEPERDWYFGKVTHWQYLPLLPNGKVRGE